VECTAYRVHQLEKRHQQLGHEAHVAARLLHVERLAKAQVAQDVKDQVVGPLGHVQRVGPSRGLVGALADQLAPAFRVLVDKHLGRAQRLVGKGLVEHAALAPVLDDARHVPGVDGVHVPRPDLVVYALFDVALGPEDGAEALGSVDHNTVGTIAEGGA
jgi:hypothetical protein